MSEVLERVSDYVDELIAKNLQGQYAYHDFSHTKETVEAAEEIGINSGLTDEEMEILLIAAWFHDAGYVNTYEKHEKEAAKIAEDYLKKINYPSEKIDKIKELIIATEIDSEPSNLIERIIKDSDIIYIGSNSFLKRTKDLKKEWEHFYNKEYSELEWLYINLEFLKNNYFYTDYAQENFEKQRQKNIEKVQNKIDKIVQSG